MGNNSFSELTRVQMPAIMHLTKLGYKYFGKITKEKENIQINVCNFFSFYLH